MAEPPGVEDGLGVPEVVEEGVVGVVVSEEVIVESKDEVVEESEVVVVVVVVSLDPPRCVHKASEHAFSSGTLHRTL